MPAFTEPRMGNHWSVDLRHYLLPEGRPAPLSSRGRRLFEYWTEIVSQATQYDDPTTCSAGVDQVGDPVRPFSPSFSTSTPTMSYGFCPRCHDDGRIAGWENTFWDNGALEPEKPS